jgi:hypothetical protein
VSAALETPLTAILALAAVCLWWLSAIRARDRARSLAAAFCQRHGWQLLDQTVALSGMRPVRSKDRMCWRRHYRFDFSPDGGERRSGELILEGTRAVRVSAELPEGGNLIE